MPHTIYGVSLFSNSLFKNTIQQFLAFVMPHRLTLSAAPVLLSPPFFAHAYIVLGYFPHPPSASNIAPENQVCKGENKDVFITTLFSEFTKNR